MCLAKYQFRVLVLILRGEENRGERDHRCANGSGIVLGFVKKDNQSELLGFDY